MKRIKTITITDQQDNNCIHVSSKGQNNFKNYGSIHELYFSINVSIKLPKDHN